MRTSERPQDRSRLADLYARHWAQAARLAYLLTGDRNAGEDLAQEAFARLVGRFRHLRDPAAFGAYLRRAIVNLHLSRLRRLRLERDFVRSGGGGVARHTSSIPDVDARTDVWRALAALPRRQRATLVLRYYEDLSERETAEVLRCSIAAVKSLTARGMKTLREQMGAWGR